MSDKQSTKPPAGTRDFLPDDIRRAIAAMDGTETTLLAGRRVFTRPDLPLIGELADADPATVDRALGADDLRCRLVPVGQDAAFAASLAERHVTAGGILQALTRGIAAHVAAARECRPLAPGAPLAADHGTAYPVLQGPMTRVSDRAAFAELYRRTSAHLFGVVLRINRDRGQAEDVLQEAYVNVWRAAGGFDAAKAQPLTWLASIARNRAIDSLRRQQAQPRLRSAEPVARVSWTPSIATEPLVGAISPASILIVVVLPAPFGPSSVTISPALTVSETSRTAVRLSKTRLRCSAMTTTLLVPPWPWRRGTIAEGYRTSKLLWIVWKKISAILA